MTLNLTVTVGRTEDIGALVGALRAAAQSRRAEAEMLDRTAAQVIEQGAKAAHAELSPPEPVAAAAGPTITHTIVAPNGGVELSDDEVETVIGPQGPTRAPTVEQPTTQPAAALADVDVGGLLPEHIDLIPDGTEWMPPPPTTPFMPPTTPYTPPVQ